MEKVIVKVEGMSCEHCSKAVTNAVQNIAGTSNVSVNLKGGSVSFEYDPAKTTLPVIKKAITEEGFSVKD